MAKRRIGPSVTQLRRRIGPAAVDASNRPGPIPHDDQVASLVLQTLAVAHDVGMYEPPPNPALGLWSNVVVHQMGVMVRDPVGHKIGPNIAYRTGHGLNWYPVDRFKQTLVGTVEGFGIYDPVGDEADWNIYIRPTLPFQFTVDDVLPNADPDQLHRADDGRPLIEAEITPDETLFDNPFFPQQGSSPLVGRRVGVYGPWVQEEAHGWRPEIHPCELVWWRGVGQDANARYLMAIQDDSNRFDRQSHFSGQIAHPWSEFPRHAEVRIAVEVPSGQRRVLVIEELFWREVRSSAPGNGPRVSTRPVGAGGEVRVERAFPNRRHVGIKLESFYDDLTTQTWYGFVVLTLEFGGDDHGREGYIVLKVTAA